MQCFSSAPKELRLRPAATFALAPGAINEVDLTLRPTHAGRKQYVVHAVDLQVPDSGQRLGLGWG